MPSDVVTVNSRKYDGTIRRSWKCKLVGQKGPALEFVGEFDRDVSHPDLGLILTGTISYEYYWLDRWYSIFRFHESGGEFRNFYCNINMPPTFSRGVLDYVDLDIDIVVRPDRSFEILDLAEFEENSSKFGYTNAVRRQVRLAQDELTSLIAEGSLPA